MEVMVYVDDSTAIMIPSFLLPSADMQQLFPRARPQWIGEIANDCPAAAAIVHHLYAVVP